METAYRDVVRQLDHEGLFALRDTAWAAFAPTPSRALARGAVAATSRTWSPTRRLWPSTSGRSSTPASRRARSRKRAGEGDPLVTDHRNHLNELEARWAFEHPRLADLAATWAFFNPTVGQQAVIQAQLAGVTP